MPLDPQVQRYLARAQPRPEDVTERREQTRNQRVIAVEDRAVPGPAGDIPIRIYTPPGERPLPVLVYFHGGGWVTGDLDVTDSLCRIIAEWAACLVVSVNYRHAPEHPFPAAIDDAYAATAWVGANIASLGGDPSRVGVGGASAGGNLAAAVALHARDQGSPAIVYQYLVYPVTDSSMSAASYEENADGYGLTAAAMRWYWDQYVPDLSQRTNPLASPIHASDFAGLPRAYVITAEFDPLRDEGEAYAHALKAAGVEVRLKRFDGTVHGFLSNHGEFDHGKLALMESAAELRDALGRVPSKQGV